MNVGENTLGNFLVFLVLLLIPVALFGFQAILLLAWILFSVIATAFASHIISIVKKSRQGEFPARIAVPRALIFGVFALIILWMFFALTPFGMAYSATPRGEFLNAAVITAAVYVITIAVAFIWGRDETQAILENRQSMAVNALNMFGGWMQIYFWIAVLFLAIITNLFLSVDIRLRFLLLILPFASLMLIILTMKNTHLILTLFQIGIENSPYQKTLKEAKKQIKEERKARPRSPMRTPVWCEGCNAQGEIEVDDPEGNYFVICEVCGTETAEVWCDEGVGGQFVHNVEERPMEYDCEICKKTHRLPDDFYEKPVALELIE
ncbi:MAG: hypothetical protein HND51_12620 [Chloroflexi bacterium]|nr:hypothetical protein [Chloroflexota bacterium]